MSEQTHTLTVRPARDEDGDGIGWLTARCWADYPGSYFDRHGEMASLDHIASAYEAKGGLAWVAVREDRIVGSIGLWPAGEIGGAWEITRMYVNPTVRRAGLASLLVDTAEDHAAAAGAKRMLLWTDTRFVTAHAFYESRGYVTDGRARTVHDLSNSVEYFYAKWLGG